jgi:DNA-binding CsgD family transcriptional regulator
MGLHNLTSKEIEALALIAQGHDAKSAALKLSLSTHTIYERLRRAREKVGVGSSREAARLVFNDTTDTNEKFVYQKLALSIQADVQPFQTLPQVGVAVGIGQTVSKHVPSRAQSIWSLLLASLPLRAEGEREIRVSRVERIRLIGDLSSKLAMAFVAICLAAMVLSNVLMRG